MTFPELSIGQFVYVDNSPDGFENSVKVKVERAESGINVYKPEISKNLPHEFLIDFKTNNELIDQFSNLETPTIGEDGGVVPILMQMCCVKIHIYSNGSWVWIWDCDCFGF
ncbi:MAG: hypothetical protein ACK5IC_02720 [Moheibacter sp.]